MNENNNIQYLGSQQDILIKWIKSMPLSQKKCIKNILSVNSGNGILDKKVINLLPNIKNYYIMQSEYDNYQNCIRNLFGNFKFKISYSDLFDYDLDTYITYDVIVFFDGFSDLSECSNFINCCTNFINKESKIWIFTHEENGYVNDVKKYFNVESTNDKMLKDTIVNLKCKIFNTHIPTFINVNSLNLLSLSQIIRKKCNNNDLLKFKEYTIKNYGENIEIPISVIILSNIKN